MTLGPVKIENSLFVGNLMASVDANNTNGAAWAHYSQDAATIHNSTFVGNGWYNAALPLPDPGSGTGAAIWATGPVTATDITFGGHAAQEMLNTPSLLEGPIRLRNTVMNLSEDVPLGCSADVLSLGFNMSTGGDCTMFTQEGDQLSVPAAAMDLQPLADNGGPTGTIALGEDSVAIDTGPAANCPATDQRGVLRPQDGDGDGLGECDRGAFEAGEGGPEPTATATESPTPTVPPTQTPAPTATHTPTGTPTIPAPPTNTPSPTLTATATTSPVAEEVELYLPLILVEAD